MLKLEPALVFWRGHKVFVELETSVGTDDFILAFWDIDDFAFIDFALNGLD